MWDDLLPLLIVCWTMQRSCLAVIYPIHAFSHRETLSDTVCPENDVTFNLNLDSRLLCSAKCAQTYDCRGLMYDSNNKICVGCRGKYTELQSLNTGVGFEYYMESTNNYHLFCDQTIDCNEVNTICEGTNHICVCTPGYSRNYPTRTCTAGCAGYGDTFENYTGYYMVLLNHEKWDGVSLQACIDRCASAPYGCRSFDREYGSCWFSTATPLTHPTSYAAYASSTIYYNRNCV